MKRGQASWTPLYMLLVVVIAAIVVVSLVKPAFVLAAQEAAARSRESREIAGAALFLLATRFR